MISLDEALDRVLQSIAPLGSESVSIRDAAGRVTAAPVVAGHNQPPFAASAMDGYALKAAALAGPDTVLKLVGRIEAGEDYRGPVAADGCVRIFTGAAVPAGYDTVVMQEEAQEAEGGIRFAVAPPAGDNVRPVGNDFAEGNVLIDEGTPLSPALVALTAAANLATLPVCRKPVVAMVSTGSELIPPGQPLGPFQIVSSNPFGLGAMVAPLVSRFDDLGIVADDMDATEQALGAALEADPDILLTSGGVSVGDKDLVQRALKKLGVELDFWKIAMRPGKPVMVGRRGKTLIIGLPGNPVSAMVSAKLLVEPALKRLGGWADPRPLVRRYPLFTDLPANGPRRHFRRGYLSTDERGVPVVVPLSQTDSAHLTSLARADTLIVQRENADAVPAGTPIETIAL